MTLDYCEPEITASINRLTFHWPMWELKVIADRLDESGKAELWFYHQNGTVPRLMKAGAVNLMAPSSMASLAKQMAEHSGDVPWKQALTFITSRTIEYVRQGEPGHIIEADGNPVPHPGYYVEPFILKGLPTIIYGNKGINKTTMLLALLGLVHHNDYGHVLGLNVDSAPNTPVALLDWESNEQMTKYTMSRLMCGGSTPFYPLCYLHCTSTLADDAQRIANFINENKCAVTMIDSLGKAAGSDKFDSSGKGTALRFFEVLGKMNYEGNKPTTPVIIAQTAKGEEGKKTIYGSVYFQYYARNVFQLKKAETLDKNKSSIAFFHEDSNYSELYDPIGFDLEYADGIHITPAKVTISQFLESLPQKDRIVNSLKSGAKTAERIANDLGLKKSQVSVLLTELLNAGRVLKLGSGMWGRPTDEED